MWKTRVLFWLYLVIPVAVLVYLLVVSCESGTAEVLSGNP
jgi:hypothetical protein